MTTETKLKIAAAYLFGLSIGFTILSIAFYFYMAYLTAELDAIIIMAQEYVK